MALQQTQDPVNNKVVHQQSLIFPLHSLPILHRKYLANQVPQNAADSARDID